MALCTAVQLLYLVLITPSCCARLDELDVVDGCIAFLQFASVVESVEDSKDEIYSDVQKRLPLTLDLMDEVAPTISSGKRGADDLNLPARVGCSMDTGDRALLTAVVQAYHGSTAVEEVIMSSATVATLCKCNDWQCEAEKSPRLKGGDSWSWDYSSYLETLGGCWDLSKKVLFQKFMVPHRCGFAPPRGTLHGRKSCQSAALAKFDESIAVTSIPPIMWNAGIRELIRPYLLLWRPLCLTNLSSNARKVIEEDLNGYSTKEMMELEIHLLKEVAKTYDILTSRGARVLVVSLASLIWEPDRNQERLQKWLPCMEQVNFRYVPKENIDVFTGNVFKAQGSVREYGEGIDPSPFYDVAKRECTDYMGLLDRVHPRNFTKGMDISAFLTSLS